MTPTAPTAHVDEGTKRTEAVEWLARRIRWERRLAELRDTTIEIPRGAEVGEAA